jgi:hypothetical protein
MRHLAGHHHVYPHDAFLGDAQAVVFRLADDGSADAFGNLLDKNA